MRLDPSGHAVVATGACCQGQGHETSFAQIAADALGIPLDWVTVVGGDTAAIPFGVGTFASRAVNAGSSIHEASGRVKDKIVAAAAALLEAAPSDIEVSDGTVAVRGAPGSVTPLAAVIRAAIPTFAKPGVTALDFEATVYHHQPTVTYTSAVHVAVDVDTGTGAVALRRYLRPRLRQGDQPGHRGRPDPRRRGPGRGRRAARGDGLRRPQLQTGTLMDYLVPTAMELPPIEMVHLEYPSPRNPLGVKGIGEGGAISPPAAIANAVEDALAPWKVRVTRTPLGPSVVLGLLGKA